MSELVVLKFGGLSVGSPELIRLAAARIAAWRSGGTQVVAVVSASGHTTDRILSWLDSAAGPDRSGRESDKALATGEQLSAALVAAALSTSNCQAVSLNGTTAGLRATGGWGEGHLSGFDERPIQWALGLGVVPVVAGFQAALESGEIVTLGRGASDLTAVYLAAQLGADECHIITDVDGVYSADPRQHPNARRYDTLSHDQLVALAAGGASVMQVAAAEAARSYGVVVRVYHYKSALSGVTGTVIRSDASRIPGSASRGTGQVLA